MPTAPGTGHAQVALEAQEHALLAALRAGDETAFATLVDRYSASMIRVAQGYVRTRGRRGGRAGGMARRPQGARPVRGPLGSP
ncbi:MAG TPA: hypothetical protein VHK22_10330 [Gaiellaceae bacterium]|nr:hypothetical protein [Gaiellaceae bacterium]